jgi:hypothetical protein
MDAAAASRTNVTKGSEKGVYIVQLLDDPATAYRGGVPGLNATKAPQGKKIDRGNPDVVRYASYLDSRHNDALAKAGGGRKLYDYHYSFNGFAAELTKSQADALSRTPGTVVVNKDEIVHQDTASTPKFLGLSDPGGLWDQLGGVGGAGEEIIIGIVDSGIWPESASFSDRSNGSGSWGGSADYQNVKSWTGTCVAGERFTRSACNQKLIGARWFNEAWGGDAAVKADRPWEFASARDYNGHGTHTASTAGGNNGVATTGAAAAFGTISGIAPRARIAAYKALWSTKDASTASGFTSDLVAAIDQAVADGVDVINYSISGTSTNFLDPVEVSFLFAADAGVFVAASAGNSGSAASTVAHPSPWITTVAAGTHNRAMKGTAVLGNDTTYPGVSTATSAAGPAGLINASAAGLPGANANLLRQCYSAGLAGTAQLDPAKVRNKIVVCERGGQSPNNARVDKSLAVLQAGGIGMILVNVLASGSLNADFHSVPTVHLPSSNRVAIEAYAAAATATATVTKSTVGLDAPAPFTAGFSSRGPLLAGGGDLLKPDVIAPGVDILASVAPPGNGGLNFSLYSGTSMSSPHVAGLAALLKHLHSDWTPMMIKSALMTSAYDVLDSSGATRIFGQGAGHVKPNSAASPGLVYDSGFNDWLAFLCGTTRGVNPSACSALSAAGYSLDPSNLNSASIAIGDLAGVQTVTRKVTNVGSASATYTASVTGMTGITTQVLPSSLTLSPGQTGTFRVVFTRTTADFSVYTAGQLTWTSGTRTVRSPIVVRPVALAAPAQVSGNGAAMSYNVTFGYTGTFTATARGLVPAITTTRTIAMDPASSGDFIPGAPDTQFFDVVVPAGTSYARFSLFDANTTPGSDLDLYVYRGATLVGSSGSGTSNEEVNIVDPASGTYRVWVHAYGTPSGGSTYTQFAWVLGTAAAGNMTVSAPASATLGAAGTINLTFSGLATGTKYLGSVAYTGSTGLPNPTIVRVDKP